MKQYNSDNGNTNRWSAVVKATIGIISMLFLFGCTASVPRGDGETSHRLEGSIRGNEYVGPDSAFRVNLPVMYNPFVKEASVTHDQRRTDGGAEVTFAVPDLGEAWRFGARPIPSSDDDSQRNPELSRIIGISHGMLASICDEELDRWHSQSSSPKPILEEKPLHKDAYEVIRVYYVSSGSLLHAKKGDSDPKRQGALIGVLAKALINFEGVLFVVGQFDMPNYGGHYTLETQTGREKLAAEHLRRLRELSVSLRKR